MRRQTLAMIVAALCVTSTTSAAQSSAKPSRADVSLFVAAGPSAFSRPILSGSESARRSGGAGAEIAFAIGSHAHVTFALATNDRGSNGADFSYITRYLETAVMGFGRVLQAGRLDVDIGLGPVLSWARNGTAKSILGPNFDVPLDVSPQEVSARASLQARVASRLPITGRVSFQQGLTGAIGRRPNALPWSNGAPQSKQLAFSLGATVWQW